MTILEELQLAYEFLPYRLSTHIFLHEEAGICCPLMAIYFYRHSGEWLYNLLPYLDSYSTPWILKKEFGEGYFSGFVDGVDSTHGSTPTISIGWENNDEYCRGMRDGIAAREKYIE